MSRTRKLYVWIASMLVFGAATVAWPDFVGNALVVVLCVTMFAVIAADVWDEL